MTNSETRAPNLLYEADLIALMEKHGIGMICCNLFGELWTEAVSVANCEVRKYFCTKKHKALHAKESNHF